MLQRQVAETEPPASSDNGQYLSFGAALASVISGFANDRGDLSLQY